MGLDFILLAGSASLDVVHNPLVHLQPLVQFLDFPKCFISSRMPGSGMIMELL